MFWGIFFLMTCSLLWITSLCLREQKNEDNSNSNLLIHRNHWTELNELKEKGLLSEKEFESQSEELHRRILEENSEVDASKTFFSKKTEKRLTVAILATLTIFAVYLYFQLGHPSLSDYSSSSQPSELSEDRMVSFLKESPNDLRALLAYAQNLSRQARTEEAIEVMDKAFNVGKDKLTNDSAFLLERASLLASSTNTLHNLRAEQEFIRATIVDSQNPMTWYLAAQWFLSNNKFEMAAIHLEKLLSFYPAGTREYSYVSSLLEEAKDNYLLQ